MKRDHQRELKAFLRSKQQHEDFVLAFATLRSLPDTIDQALASLAAQTVIRMIDGGIPTGFKRLPLPASVMREVLADDATSNEHLFLQLAIRADAKPAALVKSWQHAVAALYELDSGSWGSKPRRDRIRALAKDRALLPAVQGVAANRKQVPLDMLAALVADGSAASIDALVPHIDPALVARDERLDRLAKLRTYAKRTPALDALLGELDEAVSDRKAGSPALAIAKAIGIEGKGFWFKANVSSPESTLSIRVIVDSRASKWFEVYASAYEPASGDVHVTSFTAKKLECDEFKIGRCEAADVPAWLAGVAAQLGLTWGTPYVSSSVRGANRDRIASWLVTPPAPTRSSSKAPAQRRSRSAA